MTEYGQGTIEPIGQRFRARIYISGRPKHIGMFGTREEAESALRGFVQLKVQREIEDNSTPTLKTYGARWLDRREADGKRSIDDDRNRWTNHVARAKFFNWPLDTIRRRDIARWIDGLKAKRAADNRSKRALSWQTVKHCRTLLSGCLGAAVDDEIIERNPAAGIRLERPTSADAGWTFLTPAEQERLLSNAKIPEAERVIMGFAIATGLRQGEQWCLELRDLHVDGDDPHVFVRWGSPGLPPKNGKTRRVSLTGNGLAHAKRWLELLPDYLRRQNGRAHYENQFGLVFPTLRGHRRRDGKPPRAWKTWLALAKLSAATDRHDGRPVRWHDLRHTCASSLIAGWWGRAWRIEEIREHLGHSSIKVTERYAHLASTVLQAAAAATPGLPTSGASNADRPKTVQGSASGAPIEGETKGAPHWIRTSGLRLRRPSEEPNNFDEIDVDWTVFGRLDEASARVIRAVASRNRFSTRYALELAEATRAVLVAVSAAPPKRRTGAGQ